ncbi:hypothetical protein [Pseudobacteroides cellulosolvens]|uniref:hypothetical protein n=1 Tax=Pseudobacteroides cellulosolvens TaxID=35825 RepID=UPI00128EBEC9|nr:hypothetical protein [Pseudobacteroides cellulosolvens]
MASSRDDCSPIKNIIDLKIMFLPKGNNNKNIVATEIVTMLLRPYLEIITNSMYENAVNATMYNKEIRNPIAYTSKVTLFI